MKLRTTLAWGALAALCGCAHRGGAPLASPAPSGPAYPLPTHPGPAAMPKVAGTTPSLAGGAVGTGKHQYYDQRKRRFYYYDPLKRRYYWENGDPKM